MRNEQYAKITIECIISLFFGFISYKYFNSLLFDLLIWFVLVELILWHYMDQSEKIWNPKQRMFVRTFYLLGYIFGVISNDN